ncbi:hypothetical protein SAY87_005296 [Trapa incisa]|uniref:Transmembrane protein n=1 Tax=Trapa incisa TaxID=236973 RepID=A0AAN7K9L0_9MYRT|nr:hypothetical protein SAY87_005296 [Trapa incisa]
MCLLERQYLESAWTSIPGLGPVAILVGGGAASYRPSYFAAGGFSALAASPPSTAVFFLSFFSLFRMNRKRKKIRISTTITIAAIAHLGTEDEEEYNDDD